MEEARRKLREDEEAAEQAESAAAGGGAAGGQPTRVPLHMHGLEPPESSEPLDLSLLNTSDGLRHWLEQDRQVWKGVQRARVLFVRKMRKREMIAHVVASGGRRASSVNASAAPARNVAPQKPEDSDGEERSGGNNERPYELYAFSENVSRLTHLAETVPLLAATLKHESAVKRYWERMALRATARNIELSVALRQAYDEHLAQQCRTRALRAELEFAKADARDKERLQCACLRIGSCVCVKECFDEELFRQRARAKAAATAMVALQMRASGGGGYGTGGSSSASGGASISAGSMSEEKDSAEQLAVGTAALCRSDGTDTGVGTSCHVHRVLIARLRDRLKLSRAALRAAESRYDELQRRARLFFGVATPGAQQGHFYHEALAALQALMFEKPPAPATSHARQQSQPQQQQQQQQQQQRPKSAASVKPSRPVSAATVRTVPATSRGYLRERDVTPRLNELSVSALLAQSTAQRVHPRQSDPSAIGFYSPFALAPTADAAAASRLPKPPAPLQQPPPQTLAQTQQQQPPSAAASQPFLLLTHRGAIARQSAH
jgi:hypothetical protein